MRKLLLLILLMLALPLSAFSEGIAGTWFYYKKIYQGHEMPEPPEAKLRLYISFSRDGISRLWYWHEGDGDFCERRGVYEWENSLLHDRITWVNPRNSSYCSQDPDMQLGHESYTPLSLNGGEIWLSVSVGDESLIYVWRKVDDTFQHQPPESM